MSISYEEALETLEAMFGDPWTRETLDAVLRHHQGHMENTVDQILQYGDGDPAVLVHQLQSGIDPQQTQANQDELLARQLALEGRRPARAAPAAAVAAPAKKGRGTPTTLPDDFLRIPGYTSTTSSTAAAGTGQVMSDEALARMLQDELFSDELARNPDFAHLARGSGSAAATQQRQRQELAARQRASAAHHATPQSPNLVKGLQELGDNAKKRLQLLAAQFNANINRGGVARAQQDGSGAGGPDSPSERRGLLDDADDMELAARKEL